MDRLTKHLLFAFGPRLLWLSHHAAVPLRLPAAYGATAPPNPAPVISVVTPSFNQAAYLERTLTSVLAQNYPRLEYFVQDGGSTDGSRQILEKLDPRLTGWVSEPDRGQGDALNRAFARTTGELMAWLNADDLSLPGALAYVARFFAAHPEVDVVYGHRILIDGEDREIGRWVLPRHDETILRWADYVPQETLFWRRRLWERAGGRLDESYRFALDWELLLRFQAAGAKMVRLPHFLGAFRVHPAQKTSAQMEDVGREEMARLRVFCHGRPISKTDVKLHIWPYLARSMVYHALYWLKLTSY